MASWPMRNIKRFPSKQMDLCLSLVERKEAEFYHNIDRRRYLVWFKRLIFIAFPGQFMVSLADSNCYTGLIVICMVTFVDQSVIQKCYKETPKIIWLLLSLRLFLFRCLTQNSTLIEDITEISVSKTSI